MKKENIIALVIVGIILLVISIVIAINLKTTISTSDGGSSTSSTPGIFDAFQKFKDLFQTKDCVYGCNKKKPGYDCKDKPAAHCGYK